MHNLADHNDQLDLVLAYILGEVTEEERLRVEVLLASNDPQLKRYFEQSLDIFAELPSALPPAAPPAFIKDRVMARVHEDAVAYLIADDLGANYAPPVPFLTRLLNMLPGYGTVQAARISPKKRSSVRGTLTLSFAIFAGFIASAYALEKVSHVVQKAEQARTQVIERVRHTRAFAEKFRSESAYTLPTLSEHQTPETLDLGHASASIAQPEELAIRDVTPARPAVHPSVAPQPANAVPAVAAKSKTESVPLSLNTLEGALYFMNDRSGLHFALRPVNSVEHGKASLYWNTSYGTALFSYQDLKPTTEDQHYSLRYVLDDGTTEQVAIFEGGGNRQTTINYTPGPHVVAAQLWLESGITTGQRTHEVVLSAASRLQNK
jgi:hypothetical protein